MAGIDLQPEDKDGMHVMPSESLDFLVPPAMKIALGLDALTDSERVDSGSESHELFGNERPPIWREDSGTERKRGTVISEEEEEEEEDLPNKPSNMSYSSQGWGQPNSLIVSGGCDKVVRVWDTQSG
jgi:F-box and WD-40 domain protein CDC4